MQPITHIDSSQIINSKTKISETTTMAPENSADTQLAVISSFEQQIQHVRNDNRQFMQIIASQIQSAQEFAERVERNQRQFFLEQSRLAEQRERREAERNAKQDIFSLRYWTKSMVQLQYKFLYKFRCNKNRHHRRAPIYYQVE